MAVAMAMEIAMVVAKAQVIVTGSRMGVVVATDPAMEPVPVAMVAMAALEAAAAVVSAGAMTGWELLEAL